MKLQTLQKTIGLLVLAAIAIGAIALATGSRARSDQLATAGGDHLSYGDDAADNSVNAQIDQALGRQTSSSEASAGKSVPGAAPAPPNAVESRSVPSKDGASPVISAPVAPASGAGGSTGTASVDPLQTASDRKIVQTASLRLQVKEVGGGFQEVGRIATAAGGFVASSSFSYQGEVQVASVTVRVPAARYQDVLSQLRGLGSKVDAETSNASDVTEEYSDLSARLRNLDATETQLLGFLAQARNVSEVLQVQDRLNNVRGEIERARGRMNLLDKLTDLTTITVHLRPVVVGGGSDAPGSGIGATVREAWDDSLAFLEGIAEAVLTVVVFVWWLPLLAIPAYVAYQRFGRRLSTGNASRD